VGKVRQGGTCLPEAAIRTFYATDLFDIDFYMDDCARRSARSRYAHKRAPKRHLAVTIGARPSLPMLPLSG
jgi:hypothetical protein